MIKSLINRFYLKNDRNVLFYRNFLAFQGGHLKTWNYYQYLNNLPGFSPKIYFSKQSVWDQNPWKDNCIPEKKWEPEKADILFLAGLDWGALENRQISDEKPIINLIQAIRHADSNDIRYQYLSRKAIRICVSEEVAIALKNTNQVNGPIFTIPNAVDIGIISKRNSENEYDVVISGLKNKALAKAIKLRLEAKNISVELIDLVIPRDLYLEKISRAKVSLLLPAKTEGFYLPALESMAVGTLTVCPDCVGNRKFCKPDVNCFMPDYDADSLFKKTLKALDMTGTDYVRMTKQGLATSEEHSLKKEQSSFYEIMNNIDQIW